MSRSSGDGNIRVVCRFRPRNKLELGMGDEGREVITIVEPDTVKLGESNPHTFTFDRVLNSKSLQRDAYDCIARPIVNDVMSGYNGTIFAYGQTGSGKTFTMEGRKDEGEAMLGILPRVVGHIFEDINASPEDLIWFVKCSYVEIYLERIRDLINTKNSNLQIREDKIKGVYIEGCTEWPCNAPEDIFECVKIGSQNRSVAATRMNEDSSRSHGVFQIIVQCNKQDGSSRTGKLYLVDLAGSEKVQKTEAAGQQLEEAKTINKSLSLLASVIQALTDKTSHIPYRDSKLTRILQESLGGNSRTTLVICASPSAYNEEETLSTLRFGARAKKIKNKAKINAVRSIPELLAELEAANAQIEKHKAKISDLEGILKSGGQYVGGGEGDSAALTELRVVYAEALSELRELKGELEQAKAQNAELLEVKEGLVAFAAEREAEIQEQAHAFEELEGELKKYYNKHKSASQEIDRLKNELVINKSALEKYEFEGSQAKMSSDSQSRHYEQLKKENEMLKISLATLSGGRPAPGGASLASLYESALTKRGSELSNELTALVTGTADTPTAKTERGRSRAPNTPQISEPDSTPEIGDVGTSDSPLRATDNRKSRRERSVGPVLRRERSQNPVERKRDASQEPAMTRSRSIKGLPGLGEGVPSSAPLADDERVPELMQQIQALSDFKTTAQVEREQLHKRISQLESQELALKDQVLEASSQGKITASALAAELSDQQQLSLQEVERQHIQELRQQQAFSEGLEAKLREVQMELEQVQALAKNRADQLVAMEQEHQQALHEEEALRNQLEDQLDALDETHQADVAEKAKLKKIEAEAFQKIKDFDVFRDAMTVDFQNRCEKVLELAEQLDQQRDAYNQLMADKTGDKVLKQKLDKLERDNQRLNAAYQQALNQIQGLRTEMLDVREQVRLRDLRIRQLEDNCADFRDRLKTSATQLNQETSRYRDRITQLEQELSSNQKALQTLSSNNARGGVSGGIRGGTASSARPASVALSSAVVRTGLRFSTEPLSGDFVNVGDDDQAD